MSTATKTLTPTFIAYLDDTRFSAELESQVKEIIILDVLDGYASFTVKISDPEKKFIDSEELFIGSELRIMLGYKDEVEDVIIGEITGLIPEFRKDEDSSVILKGHNRLYRLDSGKQTRSFTEMGPQEILEQIADEAGLDKDIDIPGEASTFTMQRDLTNFEYAMNLAEYHSCKLWVTDNTMSVKKQEANTAEEVILEWGKTLHEFYPMLNCRGLMNSVEVRGMDLQNQPVSGLATSADISVKVGGDLMGADKVKDQFGENKSIEVDFTITDATVAQQMAVDYLTENSFKYITATGRCEGNNLIKAGIVLEIKEVGKRFEGKYLATSVRHRFVPAVGYETEFFLNRNTIIGKQETENNSSGTSSAIASSKQEEKKEEGALHPEFSNLAWKNSDKDDTITETIVGNVVLLTADVKHIRNGKTVNFSIWEKDKNNPDDKLTEIRAMIKDGKAQVRWKYEHIDDSDDVESTDKQYTKPEYYFVVSESRFNIVSEQSPILEFKDWVELNITDGAGNTLKNTKFKVFCADGTEQQGETDDNGYTRIDNIPPGEIKIQLDDGTYELELK